MKVGLLLKIPGGGGGSQERGGWARGWEGDFWGGGATYFVSGPIFPPRLFLFAWAVLGFQDVMKQEENRRNKREKQKRIRKRKTKNGRQKPPRFCGGFCWPFLTIKLGSF